LPRILVRLGVSQDMASLLLDDFRDAIAHFSKHPVTVSMTKQESGGFSHLQGRQVRLSTGMIWELASLIISGAERLTAAANI